MKLLEMLKLVNVNNVWKEYELYYHKDKQYCTFEVFESVYDKLIEMEYVKTDLFIELYTYKDGFDEEDNEEYYAVHGVEIDNHKETYAIEYNPWNQWISMDVKLKDADLSREQCVAHIFWEMTWAGHDEETIQKEVDKLKSIIDGIEDGTIELVEMDLDELF